MASNNTSLMFSLLARDVSVGKTISGVERRTKSFMGTLGKLAGLFGIAFGARAIVSFGSDAVRAYADAEKQQNKLIDAVKRFPAVQGASVAALQKWNTELARTSRFDDDAIAGAEAQLLQYGLTEDQLRKLIPLTLDYAARTGKDLSSASEDLGKALLGTGRALKEVGIDFDDTGTLAGNFDQLIAGLSTQVGGFAQTDLATAEGKLENLQNRFGEIQEQIGGSVMEVLGELADEFSGPLEDAVQGFADWLTGPGKEAISGFIGFIVDNKDDILTWAGNIGTLTAAVWLLNIAMDANPVGAVVAGIGLIATAVVYLTTVNKKAGQDFLDFAYGMQSTIYDVLGNILGAAEGFVNGIIMALNNLLAPLNLIRSAFGLPALKIENVDFTSDLDALRTQLTNDYNRNTAFMGASPSMPQANAYQIASALGIPGYAEGAIVSAATLAMIGEGREPEVVAPLSRFPELAAAAGISGGGSPTQVDVHPVFEFTGGAAAFAGMFDIYYRKADGTRVLVSKMGKQRS